MDAPFVNRVSESALTTLDLETLYPTQPLVVFDLKDYLFMGLILKEKDFREALKTLDTTPFQDKLVAVTCSADAIIPMWAYMLVAATLQPVATDIRFGTEAEVIQSLLVDAIRAINRDEYVDKRVVIKGCGEKAVGEAAYLAASAHLLPVVKSIMYGEPCSTVPIYKKK